MAVTYTIIEPAAVKCNPGQAGFAIARLILDGSATTKAITLTADNAMKTILAVVGPTVASNGIGTGVAGTTGFTATFAAGSSGHAQDVLLYGLG